MGNTLRKITAFAAAAALAALGLATVAAPAAAQSGCGGARDVSAGHYAQGGIKRLSSGGIFTASDCERVMPRPSAEPVVVNEFQGSDPVTVGTLKRWMERFDERTDKPTNLHVADAYLSGYKESEPLTRDTAAVVFAGFYGLQPKFGAAPFSGDTMDTRAPTASGSTAQWSASVAALKEAGITRGTTADTYSPNRKFTRNHAAAFFDRFAAGYTDPPAEPQPEQVPASFVGHSYGPYLRGASTPSTFTGHGSRQVLERIGVTGGTVRLPVRAAACHHTVTSVARTSMRTGTSHTECHQAHVVPTCGESDQSYGHRGARSTVKACPKPRVVFDPEVTVTQSPLGVGFEVTIFDPDPKNPQTYEAWTESCIGPTCARPGIDYVGVPEAQPAELIAKSQGGYDPKYGQVEIETLNRAGQYCGSGQTPAEDQCVEAFGTVGRTVDLVVVNKADPNKDDPSRQVRTQLKVDPALQGSG